MRTQETIWLLSGEGILALDGEPIPNIPFHSASVVAGYVHKEKLAVIVNDRDVWTFASGAWNQAVSTNITLNCICSAADGRLLVGTESARLAWIADGRLNFIESFDAVPERKLWKTPWGGPPDVRSLAVSTDGTIYANIHVGWIVRSQDGGETWRNLREDLEMDVHQVAAHTSDPETVFAATAKGFYISKNHGETFTHQQDGMPYHYQRACAYFPERDVYLVSTSRGPHGGADALLCRSGDGGKRWALVNGLPEHIGENIDTFQIIVVRGGYALVIVEDTALYETRDWGLSWQKVGDYPRLFGGLAVSMLA